MSATPNAIRCASCGQEYAAEGLFCPACGTPRARRVAGDALVGTVLGERFLVIERIGHGASGTIYRGEHVTLRRKVALKVLHSELSRDELAVERFRREATTVSEIDNDHIVEIHDFGRTPDGRLYLAMELLEGEPLSDRLARDKRLSVDRAVDILVQLGEGLMEAHAMGYVHRDLRPRNLFLAVRRGRPDFVKLLDFGLAKLVENEGKAESTRLGMTFGEPRYMSPEQARGDTVDRRADIYSTGCIAYEMLVGQAPFAGGKSLDVLARQFESMPPSPRERRGDIPPWLDAAIMRMLAKRPEDRFATVYQLVEALRQGMDSGQTAAMAPLTQEGPTGSQPAAAPVAVTNSAGTEAPRQRAPKESQDSQTPPEPEAGGDADHADADAGDAASGDAGADAASGDAAGGDAAGGDTERGDAAEAGLSGLSGAWFADGERSPDDELDGDLKARLDEARTGDASLTEDIYYDPSRRPWAKIAAGAGGVLVLLLIVAVAWPSGGGDTRDEDPPAEPASAASVLAELDQADAAPDDAGIADAPDVAPDGDVRAQATGTTGSSATGRSSTESKAADRSTATRPRSRSRRTSRRQSETPRRRSEAPRPPDPADELRDPFSAGPAESPGSGDLGAGESPDPSDGSKAARKASFHAKLGQNHLRNGNIPGAADEFKKALELDPRNVDAITGQGELALRAGLYSAAIAHLKKAARRRPRSAYVHTLLGEAYLNAGDDARAATSFRRALKLDPASTRARSGYEEASGRTSPAPPEP